MGKGTKERILTEGVDLLSRNGFPGVTLGVLSQETGMSKSGLFAHFKSKEEVQLEASYSPPCRTHPDSHVSAPSSGVGLAGLRKLGWLEDVRLLPACSNLSAERRRATADMWTFGLGIDGKDGSPAMIRSGS
jgi:AraC-like DNA-binding protein